MIHLMVLPNPDPMSGRPEVQHDASLCAEPSSLCPSNKSCCYYRIVFATASSSRV